MLTEFRSPAPEKVGLYGNQAQLGLQKYIESKTLKGFCFFFLREDDLDSYFLRTTSFSVNLASYTF